MPNRGLLSGQPQPALSFSAEVTRTETGTAANELRCKVPNVDGMETLMVSWRGVQTVGGGLNGLILRFNNDAGTYHRQSLYAFDATAGASESGAGETSISLGVNNGADARFHSSGLLTVPDYRFRGGSGTGGGVRSFRAELHNASTLIQQFTIVQGGEWVCGAAGSTTPITYVTLSSTNGVLMAGAKLRCWVRP